MENLKQVEELICRKDKLREEKLLKLQREQSQEYETLRNKLQSLKEEAFGMQENVAKNLDRLTNQQHSIHKSLQDSGNEVDNIEGLPISHEVYKEGILFLSDSVNSINNFKQIYENLNNKSISSIVPELLNQRLVSCADSTGNEFSKLRTQISQVEILKDNIDILQE